MGIVNGTTNFILTRMSEQGADYADALAEAQALGPGRAGPDRRRGGLRCRGEGRHPGRGGLRLRRGRGRRHAGGDHRHPGRWTSSSPSGSATPSKLLAIVERTGDDAVSVRVHPAMVPKTHPLAGVRDAYNAVFIEGEAAGELMLYGLGAGGRPTASAVVGDLIDATRNLMAGTTAPAPERDARPPASRVRAADPLLREPRRDRPPRGTGLGGHGVR